MRELFKQFESQRRIPCTRSGKDIRLSTRGFIHFLCKIPKLRKGASSKLLRESGHYTLKQYKEMLHKDGFRLQDISLYAFPVGRFPGIEVGSKNLPDSYAMIVCRKD